MPQSTVFGRHRPAQELQVRIRQRHPDADIEPSRPSQPGHAQIPSRQAKPLCETQVGNL